MKKKKPKPSKESIEEAMKSPEGEKVLNNKASVADILILIMKKELIQQRNDILDEIQIIEEIKNERGY